MGEQHGVGRPKFGDLVEAASHKVVGGGGITFFWEAWGLAIYDSLVLCQQPMQRNHECRRLTLSWEKMLLYVSGG